VTVEVNVLKSNATIVDALGSSLRSGGNALGTVPDLLKRVLKEGMWREFVTQRGEHVQHERFSDFVVDKPLRGIGASVDLVRRIVENDPEVLDLLDQALQNRPGRPSKTGVIHPSKDGEGSLEKPGDKPRDRRDKHLRRLRVEFPELHADVLAGQITVRAAAIQAGIYPNRASVNLDDASSTAQTLRSQATPEFLAELALLLVGGSYRIPKED
jgi:hypothetical protein